MKGRRRDNFRRGGTGVFICATCNRRTRETNKGNWSLCPECWDLAGIENTVSDGAATIDEAAPERDRLFAIVTAKGGDAGAIRKAFKTLWPERE